ncbi:MAG: PEP-CTERM sorting domain-containing protein [Phycisphaerales bacterium]|nr:PEP-CTERM sorting domain-containing protein [Phycisphaerales bacterium]
MKHIIATAAVVGLTGVAGAQAITSLSGGSLFDIYYGASTGDVVGWAFDLNTDVIVTDLGVYNNDADGLTSNHQIGIWDSLGNLMTSGTAGPGGAVVGDWTYTDVTDATLTAGERYTIGAMYASGDGDSYISSPSSLGLAAEVNATTNGVFPSIGDLGFVMPTEQSTNLGRFGPNFLFRDVPAPSALALLGLGGLVASRRRR